MLVPFRKILMGSLAAGLLAVPAMAQVKVGVVDYAKLLEDSPQAKQVQELLRAEFGPRLQQIVAAENALKTKSEKLQKDAATMSPEQRTKAEKELRDGARDLERKKQELQDDSNAKRNDEVGKLQRSLMTEVRDYAKAQNYDIVIAEGVIYATPAVDITPAVLAALQARGTKPAAPAAKP